MNARWQRVKDLFLQAQELPDAEREAWLAHACAGDDELCAEAMRLLRLQHQSMPLLDEGGLRVLLDDLLPESDGGTVADVTAGRIVGTYQLLRQIGEGGMGRVYLAERADGQFVHQVALKLVRNDLHTPALQQRFLRERDLLARLNHPNIAQLYDGGVSTDGAPYFTLEYVAGQPILAWCDTRRIDARARVRLLLKICDAVAHAHRSLIVHRDIKPSNILVTESGEPKLLDFGIAKALDDERSDLTGAGEHPLTRQYAAPEQLLGEPVTTATDVYALGLLLYVLLCGRMPYRGADLGKCGWVKAILEEGPEPLARAITRTAAHADNAGDAVIQPVNSPSIAAARSTTTGRLRRILRGDLERIVQRALAKSPHARYPGVESLMRDLRAWLDGRAIAGGTRTYRVRKFVRRNVLPLGAAALLFVAVAGAAGIEYFDAQRIAREARNTTAVKDFLLDLFRGANPAAARGTPVTLRDVADRGAARIAALPAEQAGIQAELANVLGTIYFQVGDYSKAAELHARSLAAADAPGGDVRLAATAERLEATDRASLGDNAAAQSLADDAVARLSGQHGVPRQELARALYTAGWIANRRSDLVDAKRMSEAALALARQPPVSAELLYQADMLRGFTARIAHDDKTAADVFAEAAATARGLYGDDDQHAIAALQLAGTAQNSLGDYVAAQALLQRALSASAHVFGAGNPRSVSVGEMAAVNLAQWGKLGEARAQLAQMLSAVAAAQPPDQDLMAELRLNHAEIAADLGDADLATGELVAARDYLQGRRGSDKRELAEAISALGYAHFLQGKPELAESEVRQALDLRAQTRDTNVATEQARLSQIALRRGDAANALLWAERSLTSARALEGERAPDAARAHYLRAAALLGQHRETEAESELRAALADWVQLVPPDGMHFDSVDARLALAELLARRPQDRSEAVRLARQAVQLCERELGADARGTRTARMALARAQAPGR